VVVNGEILCAMEIYREMDGLIAMEKWNGLLCNGFIWFGDYGENVWAACVILGHNNLIMV